MLRKLGRAIVPLLTLALFAGCASRYQVTSDYRDLLRDNYPDRESRETTVVFLVDGLSHLALKRELQRNPEGNLARYFRASAQKIPSAITIFPSETYPGITTLLTGLPVNQHGVFGNRIPIDGREVNFERPQPAKELEELLWDKTVFARLASENRLGVSLSYNFTTQAAAALEPDIRAGVAYSRERFESVDTRTLRSLEILLNRAEPKRWPDFIFVHLIGLDAVSHKQGPDSPEAAKYLSWLDVAISPVLQRLERAERQNHAVRAILTADHGFEQIRNSVDLQTAARFYLKKFDEYFTPIVTARYAALYLKSPLAAPVLHAALVPLSKLPLFDGIAFRSGDEIRYESRKVRLKITLRAGACSASNYEIYAYDLANGKTITGDFVCPEALENDNRGRMERIIAAELSFYFQAKDAPDAVILAATGTSFTKEGAGQHGGLNSREMEVPLLLRNARVMATPGSAVPLRKILAELAASPAVTRAEPPEAPRLAARTQGQTSQNELPVRRHLTIGTPSGLDWLRADRGSAADTWRTSFEPGISLEYSEKWSRNVGWLARYEVGFMGYLAEQRSTRHRFGVGPFYRLHEGLGVQAMVGAGQQFFAAPGPAGEASLSREWVPEITIGSPFRLLTLGVGDLNSLAELSALLPQGSGELESRAGYRESLTVSFDQSIRTWDVLSCFAQLEHERIPYARGEMSRTSTKVGISYQIAF